MRPRAAAIVGLIGSLAHNSLRIDPKPYDVLVSVRRPQRQAPSNHALLVTVIHSVEVLWKTPCRHRTTLLTSPHQLFLRPAPPALQRLPPAAASTLSVLDRARTPLRLVEEMWISTAVKEDKRREIYKSFATSFTVGREIDRCRT